MAGQYDAIVIGAGHNGLTNAAFLARAGVKTLVLEKNDYIGGATVSRELMRHNPRDAFEFAYLLKKFHELSESQLYEFIRFFTMSIALWDAIFALCDRYAIHLIGLDALEMVRPARRRLTKLVVDGNKPVGEAFIFAGTNGRQVGEVRCTTWSPILKANLAIADIEYVRGKLPENLWARFDYQRELKWRTAWAGCHPQAKPFYAPEYRSKMPPEPF